MAGTNLELSALDYLPINIRVKPCTIFFIKANCFKFKKYKSFHSQPIVTNSQMSIGAKVIISKLIYYSLNLMEN